MAHIHNVYDTDKHFSINPVTRVITNECGKIALIQGDHNSERFTFEMPRLIDGHDMSLCNVVEVHYINIDAKTSAESRDVYDVTDMQISPAGEDTVICSWLLSSNATRYVGALGFVIRFACVTEGSVQYAWHTAVHSSITVLAGINNGAAVMEDYSDILEQWREELFGNIYNSIEALEQATNEQIKRVQDAADDAVATMPPDYVELSERMPRTTSEQETHTFLEDTDIDPTLSIEGKAADAAATGEAFNSLSQDIGKHNGKYTVDYFDENSLTDGYVRNGVVTAASGWKCTDYIPCKYGDEVSLAMTTGADLNAVCVYDANKDFIANMTYSEIGSARSPWTFYMTFINCAYIRYNVVPASVLSYADQYCKVEDAAKYRDTLKEALYNHQTIYYVRSDVATNPHLQLRPNHFATLKECTEYIQTNGIENSIVHVYGTQDLGEQFGTEYLDSLSADSNVGFGLKIGNNTHFIFYEGAKVLFNYSGKNSDCTHYFSPFNVYGSFTLENATIECSNCRYSVHEDVPTSTDSVPGWYTAKYINCVMTHNGNTESFDDCLPVCIGGGTNRNSLSVVEGGRYTCPGTAPLAIAYHNFNTAAYGDHPSRVVIKNAWVSNGIRLGEFSDSTVNVEISGCYIPAGYTTGTTHFNIKAWNNTAN